MKNDSCSKIKRVLEKLVVGLGNSWPLSFVEGNETLEENFPFGVTVVVFVASTEATEPLKGFRVLSLLPETHPRPVYVTRGTNFIRVVRINPQSDCYTLTCIGETIISSASANFPFSSDLEVDIHR